MNWGKSIIIAFIFFALFIGVLVTICMKQEVNLVSKEYYRDELRYQDRITAMNNYNQLSDKPEMNVVKHLLTVQLNQHQNIEEGSIILFRPSDGTLDKQFLLGSLSNQQSFDLSSLPSGLYHLKLQWRMGPEVYFTEKVITL